MQNTFEVVAAPHPFASKRHNLIMPAGATIDDVLVEIVHRTGCEPAVLRDAAVYVGDVSVPKTWWARTRIKAGVPVVVRAVPGRNVLSLFVQIAAFAAAVYLAGPAGLGFAGKLAAAAVPAAGPLGRAWRAAP